MHTPAMKLFRRQLDALEARYGDQPQLRRARALAALLAPAIFATLVALLGLTGLLEPLFVLWSAVVSVLVAQAVILLMAVQLESNVLV